jgi:hypothetical protein
MAAPITRVSLTARTIDLFVIDQGSVLQHSHSNDGVSFGAWESWGSLPSAYTGNPIAASWGPINTMDNGGGGANNAFRLDVCATSTAGALLHRFSTDGTGSTGYWTSETQAGYTFVGSPGVFGMGDQENLISVANSGGPFTQNWVTFGSWTWNNGTTSYGAIDGPALAAW